MPVSPFGYVLGSLIESVFIVVGTRIDASRIDPTTGNSETMLENPVSITSPESNMVQGESRYKLRHRQTYLFKTIRAS
jgi:hypothetical protein